MANQESDHFEVFISYRRSTGVQYARTLYYALKSVGIRSFFDYSSIRNGKFNEAIYDAIDKADCFLLLLTRGSLDHCVQDENDWVRKEVECAITHKKVIIPVTPTDQSIKSVLPAELPPLMENALRELQISRLDTEDLFAESLYKIIADRFPAEVYKNHKNIFAEIFPERLKDYQPETDKAEATNGAEEDENLAFRFRLFEAIDSFKVSIFQYLVRDFMADLNAGGTIRVERQTNAFHKLAKLLGESTLYLTPDEHQQVYDFCDKYLAPTYNDFFDHIRKLKAAHKTTTVTDLAQFVSSRINDDFFKQYNHIRDLLVGSSSEA